MTPDRTALDAVAPSPERSQGVQNASDARGEKERAALKLTDEVVLNVRASEETFAAADKHFSPEQLMHIVLTLGQYMMTCRIVETFDVDLQPLNAEA